MTASECPYRDDCPVPSPTAAVMRRVRTVVIAAGTEVFRGHRTVHAADALVPATGNSRFAPLEKVAHTYISRRATPALLESAFHDTVMPEPRIYANRLAVWSLSRLRLEHDVRLVDLRDPQLDRLQLQRGQIVAAAPAHYPCTRMWAAALHGRRVGGRPTHGLLWNSRQAELHAAADRNPLTADLLTSGATTEVAILYAPPAPSRLLADTGDGPGPLADGQGARFAAAAANLIGAAYYPPQL